MAHHRWLPPWRARVQQQAEAERVKRESERDHAVPAAINALIDELRAERQRQATENAKKDSREKWTIRGLFVTGAVALCALFVSMYQAHLTRRSISDAEQTSTSQAKDTQSALAVAREEAAAAKSQAALAKETLVTGSRAWIGIEHTSSPQPVADKAIQVTVQYVNTGRLPATDVQVSGKTFSFPVAEEKEAATEVRKFDNQCTSLQQANVGVVYPTRGFSSYTYMPTIPANKMDSAVISGDKLLVVAGCFTYRTFKAVHYSYFCTYYRAGTTPPNSWIFCNEGNYAE